MAMQSNKATADWPASLEILGNEFCRPGGSKKYRRLSTFFWRKMECATYRFRYDGSLAVRACHVATGVGLTLVPLFITSRRPLAECVKQAEENAKRALAAYPGAIGKHPRRYKP